MLFSAAFATFAVIGLFHSYPVAIICGLTAGFLALFAHIISQLQAIRRRLDAIAKR